VIWVSGEAENFSRWDWTGGITLNRFNKFDFARRPEGKPRPAKHGSLRRSNLSLFNLSLFNRP
jgi:hypothetical protein